MEYMQYNMISPLKTLFNANFNADHAKKSGNEGLEKSDSICHKMLSGTFHKVICAFQGQMEGDLSVNEGQIIRILEILNEDWYIVENSSGEAGLFPGNHMDPTEYSGISGFSVL